MSIDEANDKDLKEIRARLVEIRERNPELLEIESALDDVTTDLANLEEALDMESGE